MLAWDEGEIPEAYDHQTVLKDAHKAMLDGLSDA